MKIWKYDIVRITQGYMRGNLAIVLHVAKPHSYVTVMSNGLTLWFPPEVLELVLYDIV